MNRSLQKKLPWELFPTIVALAWPTMLEQLLGTAVQYIDTAMVGSLGTHATAAVGATTTVGWLVGSTISALSVGFLSFIAQACGAGRREEAGKAASQAVVATVLSGVGFTVMALGLSPLVPVWMQVDPAIRDLAAKYFFILYTPMLFRAATIIFGTLLRAAGDTRTPMKIGVWVNIINVVLNFLLIYDARTLSVWGVNLWIPGAGMGVIGAAVATVTGQCAAAAVAVILNIKKNHDVHISFKAFRPDKSAIKTILAVGIPSMIMQAIGSVMTFTFNKMLIWFSSTAVAIFGIFFKLNSIVFMPVFGLNNGMVPIISYNFGAQNRKRMLKTIKYSVIYAMAIMLIGLAIIEIFPDKLLFLFNASDNMLAIGVPALRIICMSFALAGCSIVMSSVFQALGHGVLSMFISLIRQLIVLLPCAFILALIGKHNGGNVSYIWWSFDIAEIASLTTSLLFFRHIYKTVISKLPEGAD